MLAGLSSWILSIAGIVCLSVIVELILPQGQMSRYIKGVFSFVIIFVVISPLPRLLKMDIPEFNYSNSLGQDNYLSELNYQRLMALKSETEAETSAAGYLNVNISLSADIFAAKFEVKSVSVDISQLVITEKAQHKDILNIRLDIAKIIQNHISIEEGKIYFDE